MSSTKSIPGTTLTIRAPGPHSSRLPLHRQPPMRQTQLRLQNEPGKTPWHLPSLDRLHRRQADYQDDQQTGGGRMPAED
jgi:hypothetical protein